MANVVYNQSSRCFSNIYSIILLDSVFYIIAIRIYMITYYLMLVVGGGCFCALEHHYEIKQLLATCLCVYDKN